MEQSRNKVGTTTASVNNTDDIYSMGNIGIHTQNPTAALHVVGDIIIQDTPELLITDPYFVIDNTGHVGPLKNTIILQKRAPFVAQSKAGKTYTPGEITSFNTGTSLVVPWEAPDIVLNENFVTLNDATDTFTFNNNGLYECSGFLNYTPNATTPLTYNDTNQNLSMAAIIVAIEYQKNGSST